MTPGRRLDALVAEKVMGLQVIEQNVSEGATFGPPKKYSKDIARAWELVEKFKSEGKAWIISYDTHECHSTWFVSNQGPDGDYCRGWNLRDPDIYIEAETAPHAICLAALKAVGVDV